MTQPIRTAPMHPFAPAPPMLPAVLAIDTLDHARGLYSRSARARIEYAGGIWRYSTPRARYHFGSLHELARVMPEARLKIWRAY